MSASRVAAATAIAVLALIAPRLAAAECAAPKIARHELAVQAIFLGDFPDLLGHHAVWFWDPVGDAILGPLIAIRGRTVTRARCPRPPRRPATRARYT